MSDFEGPASQLRGAVEELDEDEAPRPVLDPIGNEDPENVATEAHEPLVHWFLPRHLGYMA